MPPTPRSRTPRAAPTRTSSSTSCPSSYETFIGERGVKLSGGQQQRLAIARAILASPQILILDEATSNLDTESEQLIQASMATLLAGRTTFVIAHRLSTIRRADLILLMEDGRVIERGTHEELMAARGTYYEMVLRQAESAGENIEEMSAKRVFRPQPDCAWSAGNPRPPSSHPRRFDIFEEPERR